MNVKLQNIVTLLSGNTVKYVYNSSQGITLTYIIHIFYTLFSTSCGAEIKNSYSEKAFS